MWKGLQFQSMCSYKVWCSQKEIITLKPMHFFFVYREAFIDYWVKGNMWTKEIATQIFTILKQPDKKYLVQVVFIYYFVFGNNSLLIFTSWWIYNRMISSLFSKNYWQHTLVLNSCKAHLSFRIDMVSFRLKFIILQNDIIQTKKQKSAKRCVYDR